MMREIPAQNITGAVARLCIRANCELPHDLRRRIEEALGKEESPAGREVLRAIVENYRLAEREGIPVCQDTGMATVFADVGQDIHISGGGFEEAVNEGVRRGYREGYLRCSVVSDPVRRDRNTGDNTPAVLHTRIVPGDGLTLAVAPKGFGSENMTALKMFTPSATADDIERFVVETVEKAGANPCPPIVVGVGLGGTAEQALLLAKRALIRPAGQPNADGFYAALEKRILRAVNRTGIGPQGLGGTVTALCAQIEYAPTHIAGLPCAVCLGCHATRHASETL